MGRTGKDFAYQYEIEKPDCLILGKALGGGMYPVSAFLAKEEVMNVFDPGCHGSTFGGNPLGAAIGLEALNILTEEKLSERSRELGEYLITQLKDISSDYDFVTDIRGRGLFIGMEFSADVISARNVCQMLLEKGVLSKDTHHTVVRFAPPLTISKDEIDWAIERVAETLAEIKAK